MSHDSLQNYLLGNQKANNQIPTPVDDVFENFQEKESAMIEINGGEGEEE